jgi:hypothetical protein
MKGNKELDPATYPITHTDGVITIEIINAQPGDSGKYKCVASNSLGSDTTDCVVIVEGNGTLAVQSEDLSSSCCSSDVLTWEFLCFQELT